MPWLYVAETDYPGSYSAFWCAGRAAMSCECGARGLTRVRWLTRAARRLLIDTFAAGLVAFILAMQWKWYISVKRDVKLIKANLLAGVLDRAVLREVDIADFAFLGRDKKPEAPKARARRGASRRARVATRRGCMRSSAAFLLHPSCDRFSAPGCLSRRGPRLIAPTALRRAPQPGVRASCAAFGGVFAK
jgi:hypothetical protein